MVQTNLYSKTSQLKPVALAYDFLVPSHRAIETKQSLILCTLRSILCSISQLSIILWKWCIHYASLSAMFNPLYSKTNQELYKSTIVNKVGTMKYEGACSPVKSTTPTIDVVCMGSPDNNYYFCKKINKLLYQKVRNFQLK